MNNAPDEDAVPPVPANPVTCVGDLWQCGSHRVLCGDATDPASVARLLSERAPFLLVTDPPYGIELDSEWRDKAGLNKRGPAEPSYLKRRSKRHLETTISGDTRADWSEAFALVTSLEVGYVWHASKFTREVFDGLLRIGFLHHQQIIWDKGRAVLTRTHYWFQHEPCWYVRKRTLRGSESQARTRRSGIRHLRSSSSVDRMSRSGTPTQKPVELMRKPILNHTKPGELVYDPFLGSGTTLAAAEVTGRV